MPLIDYKGLMNHKTYQGTCPVRLYVSCYNLVMSKLMDFLHSITKRDEIINDSPLQTVKEKNQLQLRIEKFKVQFRIGNLERERNLFQDDLDRLYRKGGPIERIIVGSLMLSLGIYIGVTSINNQTKIEFWVFLVILGGIVILLYGRSDLRTQKRYQRRIRELDDEIAKQKKESKN